MRAGKPENRNPLRCDRAGGGFPATAPKMVHRICGADRHAYPGGRLRGNRCSTGLLAARRRHSGLETEEALCCDWAVFSGAGCKSLARRIDPHPRVPSNRKPLQRRHTRPRHHQPRGDQWRDCLERLLEKDGYLVQPCSEEMATGAIVRVWGSDLAFQITGEATYEDARRQWRVWKEISGDDEMEPPPPESAQWRYYKFGARA
jgi:hypothetical protein